MLSEKLTNMARMVADRVTAGQPATLTEMALMRDLLADAALQAQALEGCAVAPRGRLDGGLPPGVADLVARRAAQTSGSPPPEGGAA